MGEGKRRCRSGPWDEGAGGVHKGHFHIPAGMVVRGWSRSHMPTCVTYVTEKHFFLVNLKGTLTHLSLFIVRGGAGRGGGEGRYRPGRV